MISALAGELILSQRTEAPDGRGSPLLGNETRDKTQKDDETNGLRQEWFYHIACAVISYHFDHKQIRVTSCSHVRIPNLSSAGYTHSPLFFRLSLTRSLRDNQMASLANDTFDRLSLLLEL